MRSPVLGGDEDQVAGRVLHVRVDAAVDPQARGGPFEGGVSRGGLRVGAEVIAEEQRVPLIGPARDADVKVRRAARSRLEEELAPVAVGARRARWAMVARDVLVDEARTLERRSEPGAVEGGDRDLDVDDVLRRQAWHRRRADVVDAKGERSNSVADRRGDHPELVGPARLWLDDRDPPI